MVDRPFQGAHHFLLGALKVTSPETHPPEPFHGGGPALKIDAEAYVVAALWLADRMSKYVDERDRADFDAFVKLARNQLKVGPKDTKNQKAINAANASKYSRVPAKVGAWAAHEAGNWCWRAIYAGGAARPAAANVARFLAKTAPKELPAFMKELDAYCIHLEVLTQLRDKDQKTSSKVAKGIWRGHDDKKVLCWLMRLENKKLALLFKEKTRWRLMEGDKDDVLATVPETHFEAAVHAAAASS